MKLLATHFDDYIKDVKKYNIHPKIEQLYNNFPESIIDLRNLIFYGASGVGKYSQVLNFLRRYSPSELKYEKKLNVTYDKKQYFLKISDIHYEVDMSLLGCNSKLLWHEFYQQIMDAISAKINKCGIIVCKNFNQIHSELLDNFYSYMQDNNSNQLQVKYIIITEHVSFLPNSIINCCEIIHFQRPSKTAYLNCTNNKTLSVNNLNNINNIKSLIMSINELNMPHKILCEKIIKEIEKVDDLKFQNFRDILYDLLIYGLDIYECVWFILTYFVNNNKIPKDKLTNVLLKTYSFFKYYNNNYRPIYHLESYFFYLISVIHGY
jgi:hypothetical protein